MKFCFMFVEEMKIIKEFILTHTTGDNDRQCTPLFGVLAMGMYFIIDTMYISFNSYNQEPAARFVAHGDPFTSFTGSPVGMLH